MTLLCFGPFELDIHTGELRRKGFLQQLAPQPARVLVLLARRGGELVTREELRREIWGEAAVEADAGINNAIAEARRALGDRAQSPLYIETLQRRGYRFIAPVRKAGSPHRPAMRDHQPPAAPGPPQRPPFVAPETPSPTGKGTPGKGTWPLPPLLLLLLAAVPIAAGSYFATWSHLTGGFRLVGEFSDGSGRPRSIPLPPQGAEIPMDTGGGNFEEVPGSTIRPLAADSSTRLVEKLGTGHLLDGRLERKRNGVQLRVLLLDSPPAIPPPSDADRPASSADRERPCASTPPCMDSSPGARSPS